MKAALKRGVETGVLVQVKASYKLSAEAKKKTAATAKKAAPTKKKAAPAKKKTTAPKKKVCLAFTFDLPFRNCYGEKVWRFENLNFILGYNHQKEGYCYQG